MATFRSGAGITASTRKKAGPGTVNGAAKQGSTPAKEKVRAAPKEGVTPGKPKEIEERLVRAAAQLKKEFEKVRSRLARLRSSGSAAFDEMYELIGDVLESDPPLYVGGGYRTREEFIRGELPGETARSVKRNVLVARCFSPEDEARHGIAFLEEVALYAKELAGASVAPRAIDLDRLTVTFAGKGGEVVRKKARDATVAEVRKARRGLRTDGTTKKDVSPREAAVRAVLGKHKVLKQVAVRSTREGVTFGNVPWGALGELSKALAGLKLPAEPV